MVQISKGPIGTKGSRVTTYVSLPGRYLVFMPNVEHIGVSRRIARDEERARFKDIMKRARHPGCGYIVRTVSEGVKEEELRSDVDFLHVLWQDILAKREQKPAPSVLHTDLSLSFRVVRDLFGRRVDRLLIDIARSTMRSRTLCSDFRLNKPRAFIFTTKRKVCSTIWESNRKWRGP